MAFLRKMLAQVRLDTDSIAGGATVRIMKPGCLCTGGATGYALTDNPGALYDYAWGYGIDSDGAYITDSDFRLNLTDAVTWSATDSAFKVAWDLVSPSNTWVPLAGDRLVFDPVKGAAGSFTQFYPDDSAQGTPITTSFPLPSNGIIEGYVTTRDVDIFVTYNDQDTYIVDVSTDPRDYVTPEDFGADANAAFPNHDFIQNALDYLAFVQGGGELRLLNETYFIQNATPLLVRGNSISIVGQGDSSKLTYDASNETMIQVLDGVDDFTIENITLEHLTGGIADATQGLLTIGETDGASGCDRVKIQNMKIRSRYSSAIALYGVAGFTIIGCTMGNNGGAMGGHGVLIADTSVGTASKRGIISSCQFYDDGTVTGNSGVEIEDGDRIIVSDCSIRGWSFGVRIGEGSNSNDVSVDSTHIREQTQDGIHIDNIYTMSRIAINGNTIQGCGRRGIYINSAVKNSSIVGNLVNTCGRSGMFLDNLTYSTVSANAISDCNTDGNSSTTPADVADYQVCIGIGGSSSNNVFASNMMNESGGGLLRYAVAALDGITNTRFIGNAPEGGFIVGYWYFDTLSDCDNCTFLEPAATTDAIHWGAPGVVSDGIATRKSSRLKPDGAIANALLEDTVQHRASQYVSTPAQTSITVGGTYVKAAGTFTADVTGSEMTTSTDNRLQYNGAETRLFMVRFDGSVTCENPANADPFSARIGKNGTTIAASQIDRYVASSEVGAFACSAIVSLDTGDYVEIFVTRDSATYWVQLDAGYFSAVEV